MGANIVLAARVRTAQCGPASLRARGVTAPPLSRDLLSLPGASLIRERLRIHSPYASIITYLQMLFDGDSEDGRLHKKPRTEDPSQPSTATTAAHKPEEPGTTLDNLKRHEEFWFDDGSVVLVARNTGFRVFRSLLAAQSTVFGGMLACSSVSAEEMLEGCPVVRLSDSPEDVAHLLRVLLPKSRRT